MKIQAKVISDSINSRGDRLTTVECDFPRFCLPEVSKHRNFSLSAQSTRAVPTQKLIDMTRESGFVPKKFLKNQAGMQAKNEEVDNPDQTLNTWKYANDIACDGASALTKQGLHKQWAGRLIEPFMWQRAVITATQWQNFFRLRIHADAQPEIRELAEVIFDAMQGSTPVLLGNNEWHLPYVTKAFDGYLCDNDMTDDLEEAKKYSAAKCASTSYRTELLPLVRGLDIYAKLVECELQHSVPLEHVAKPLNFMYDAEGLTHVDKRGHTWSGNFKGWAQLRHIVEQQKGLNTYD